MENGSGSLGSLILVVSKKKISIIGLNHITLFVGLGFPS